MPNFIARSLLFVPLLTVIDCNSTQSSMPPVADDQPLIEASQYDTINGVFSKGEYIDLDENDRLYIRYGALSDSGVELERVTNGTVVWRVHAKSLGAIHSRYRHEVDVNTYDDQLILINSHGTAGNFSERRYLATGALIDRTSDSVD